MAIGFVRIKVMGYHYVIRFREKSCWQISSYYRLDLLVKSDSGIQISQTSHDWYEEVHV